MHSLVVEDDVVQRAVLRRFLKPYGPVDETADARGALHAARLASDAGRWYDLVMLDIHLPQGDGRDVLAAWRRRERDLKLPPERCSRIIICTADSADDLVNASFHARCDAFLHKPVLRFDLVRHLRQMGLID